MIIVMDYGRKKYVTHEQRKYLPNQPFDIVSNSKSLFKMTIDSFCFYLHHVGQMFSTIQGCQFISKSYENLSDLQTDVEKDSSLKKILVCDDRWLMEIHLSIDYNHWDKIFVLKHGQEQWFQLESKEKSIESVGIEREDQLIYHLVIEAINRHHDDSRQHQIEGNNGFALQSSISALNLIETFVKI